MFIDHKKINAAACASFCVRSLTGSFLLCGILLGSGMVHAESGGDGPQRRDPPAQQQGNQRDRQETLRQLEQSRQAAEQRNYEARSEEQRRAMQDASRNAEMNRRVGRMTPDERRDLRRQINEVGQDIYANPPRR
jgi:hypothetical protein